MPPATTFADRGKAAMTAVEVQAVTDLVGSGVAHAEAG
jgi:hypothetical protein